MRYTILILVFFVACPVFKAQEFNDDARLWLYVKLDKDISDKWNAHLLLQNRFNNNVTEYSRVYGDFGFTYKINRHLRVMADYVYGRSRRIEGTYAHIHQAYTGIVARQKVNRFQFVYRLLFQSQVKDLYSDDKGSVVNLYERSKITVKYGIDKRTTVYVAEELNTPLYGNTGLFINRSRSFAGVEYKLSKNSSIEGYFLFQRKFKIKGQPPRDFIYGITYAHSF